MQAPPSSSSYILLRNKKNTNNKYSVQYMSKTDKAPNEHLLSPRDKN